MAEETKEIPKHPNRLRELRDRAKLNQAQVAVLKGTTQPTINRHEQGNRSLNGFDIEWYANLYGVTPYEIFVPLESWVPYNPESAIDMDAVYAEIAEIPDRKPII